MLIAPTVELVPILDTQNSKPHDYNMCGIFAYCSFLQEKVKRCIITSNSPSILSDSVSCHHNRTAKLSVTSSSMASHGRSTEDMTLLVSESTGTRKAR